MYNVAKYIDKCIVSVLKQNYDNIELILVDDGSMDQSFEICKTYANKDKRVKLLHQNNSGVSVARNNGLKHSTGHYIVFVDSDDYLLPGAITHLYANVSQTKCELVCGSYQMQKTRNRIKEICYSDMIYKDEDYDNNFINITRNIANAPWAKLFDAEIIRKNNICFPEKIPYAEDTIFLIRYCRCIRSVAVSSEVLYNYNFTDCNSAMNKFYPNLYQFFCVVLNEKRIFFSEREKKNIYNSIRLDEEEYYFEWCLKHYILHTKGDDLRLLIANAAVALLGVNAQSKYQRDILNQDWDIIIKKWKKEHRKEVIINNIKKIMQIK